MALAVELQIKKSVRSDAHASRCRDLRAEGPRSKSLRAYCTA
jgi:hypothetical protein